MSEKKTLDVELFDKYTKEWHCCGNSAKARITIMRSGPGSEDDFYEHKDALIRELVREAVRRSAAQAYSHAIRHECNCDECHLTDEIRERILAQIGE